MCDVPEEEWRELERYRAAARVPATERRPRRVDWPTAPATPELATA